MKYFIGLNLLIRLTLQPTFPVGNKYRKARASQLSTVNNELGIFPSSGAIQISSGMGVSGMRTLSWELHCYLYKGLSFSSNASSRLPESISFSSLLQLSLIKCAVILITSQVY